MPATRQRPQHRDRREDVEPRYFDLDGDILRLERFRRRMFTDAGRVTDLELAGERLPDDVADLVTDGSISLTTDGVAEINLSLSAPGYRLLGEERCQLGTPLTYHDLGFRVASIDDDGETFALTARDAVWRRARRRKGPDVDRDTSPTQFLARRFRRLGIEFLGQPSPKRRGVGMTGRETLPKTAARLASELGYYLFAASGVVYFGKPTWLTMHGARLILAPDDPILRRRPTVRLSVDNEKRAREVGLELEPAAGDRVRPGMTLELHDLPLLDEEPYLITAVDIPLTASDPVTVSASTPINPEPQPPEPKGGDDGTGGGDVTGSLKPRRYGNADLGPEQLRNVEVIWEVGRANKVGTRGVKVALIAAMTESTIRNLDYGDRDSIGIFQQRDAWGSRERRLNPRTSSLMFFTGGQGGQPGLLDHSGWENMPMGQAAQDVQVSDYPGRYAEWIPMAEALVEALQAAAAAAKRRAGSTPEGTRAVWPTTSHRISTKYRVPGSWAAGYHTGVDIDGAANDPVWSPISGRVIFAGRAGDYGNVVTVRGSLERGGDIADVMLCHLNSIGVRVGAEVRPKTRIGRMGNTGRVFGAGGGHHLHLEVRTRGGDYGDDINPMRWIGR